jgi:hypothetical protein
MTWQQLSSVQLLEGVSRYSTDLWQRILLLLLLLVLSAVDGLLLRSAATAASYHKVVLVM